MAYFYLLESQFQNEILLLRFELIERMVLFAEGNNGAGSKPVTLFRTDGNVIFIKGDHTVKAVSYHEHQAGNGDGSRPQLQDKLKASKKR